MRSDAATLAGSPWQALSVAGALIGAAGAGVAHHVDSSLLTMLFLAVAAVALGIRALSSPLDAAVLLLAALFLNRPLRSVAGRPVDVVGTAFAALIASVVLWLAVRYVRGRRPGEAQRLMPVEWAMLAYLVCNVASMVSPHEYGTTPQLLSGQTDVSALSVPRYLLVGVVIPFTLYAVGRRAAIRPTTTPMVLWSLLGVAAYSAAVSILPFTRHSDWVWPRYIVESPSWSNRAVGVFDQPVENGLVLAVGLGTALLFAGRAGEPTWRRVAALMIGMACAYGIFLTHTRAAYLSGLVVLVVGALLATRARIGYVLGLVGVLGVITVQWSVFTSSDRQSGGIGAPDEIQDRFNNAATALWATGQKPLTGWGIGRFPAVNTYHHRQWSADTPWVRGLGYVSHENELGILAELGIIAFTAWLAVLVLLIVGLCRVYRRSSADDLHGRPLAMIAIMAFVALVCTGFTVDLRFFEFPTAMAFFLIGLALRGYPPPSAVRSSTVRWVPEQTALPWVPTSSA